MLSGGMRVIKQRKLSIAIVCGIVFLILLLLMVCNHNKPVYQDSKVYYEKLLTLSKPSSEVKLGEIFDFEFDKAYVSELLNETYADEAYFLRELDVDTCIDIPTLESGVHYRILFVKDDIIVYDYIYDQTKLKIAETGIWIYSDTTLMLKQHNPIGIEDNTIHVEFKD